MDREKAEKKAEEVRLVAEAEAAKRLEEQQAS